eukprot:COSAG02_NODE_502_length_21039_cov_62.499045_11_plen_124_part_00
MLIDTRCKREDTVHSPRMPGRVALRLLRFRRAVLLGGWLSVIVSCVGRRTLPARLLCAGGVESFLSLVRACARSSSCPFCAAALGWLEPTACLGFVAGESWRLLSFASGVGQVRASGALRALC